ELPLAQWCRRWPGPAHPGPVHLTLTASVVGLDARLNPSAPASADFARLNVQSYHPLRSGVQRPSDRFGAMAAKLMGAGRQQPTVWSMRISSKLCSPGPRSPRPPIKFVKWRGTAWLDAFNPAYYTSGHLTTRLTGTGACSRRCF